MFWQRWLATAQFKYLFSGILFGFIFPLVARSYSVVLNGNSLSIMAMLKAHTEEPILWIVDTAPIFLGLFAWLAGKRQDNLQILKNKLEELVTLRTAQIQSVNIGLTQEIEERRKLAQVIVHSEKNWQTIFDSISDIIILTDADGKVTQYNRATVEATQLKPHQILGCNISAVIGYPSVDPKTDYQAPITQGQEIQFTNLQGFFDVDSYPIFPDLGLGSKIYVLKNVSDRVRLDQDIRYQKKYLVV